uniref:TLC domain-containing protein n=1 Tax=Globodera rostochiensis TaxID=31243 RepID=A0A914IC92_GLORO
MRHALRGGGGGIKLFRHASSLSNSNYGNVNSVTPVNDANLNKCPTSQLERVWMPLIVTVFSFFFFRFFQFTVRWYLFGKWTFPTFSYFKRRRQRHSQEGNLKQKMDSKSLEIVPPNKKWRISNEFVSLFHSVLSGFWALGALMHFDEYINDLVDTNSKVARYLTCMSFGYLVHDFIDLVVNEQSARIIELLFHHVVVLTGLLTSAVSCKFLYIVLIGLLMEVNSIFLHSRSLCNLYRQPKDSNLFKIIALFNIATFMLFRIVVSLILVGWVISQYFKWELEWYLQVINSLLAYSLFVTNFILCYRVLAADGILGKGRARPLPRSPSSSSSSSLGKPPDGARPLQQKSEEEGEDDHKLVCGQELL